jgi:hypothetical protein
MLKHLTQQQIDAVIAASEAMIAKSSGGIVAAKDISLEEVTARNAVSDLIAKFPREAVLELEALMWVGQGHGTFEQMLDKATKSKDGGEVHYIAGKAMSLPQYLRDGLKAAGPN